MRLTSQERAPAAVPLASAVSLDQQRALEAFMPAQLFAAASRQAQWQAMAAA